MDYFHSSVIYHPTGDIDRFRNMKMQDASTDELQDVQVELVYLYISVGQSNSLAGFLVVKNQDKNDRGTLNKVRVSTEGGRRRSLQNKLNEEEHY